MMRFTFMHLLAESIWNVNDTPMNLQNCEEWLLMYFKRGRFDKDYIILAETTNTDVHPDGVREKFTAVQLRSVCMTCQTWPGMAGHSMI